MSRDYRAMVNPPKGGSEPGRDVRRIGWPMKLAIQTWTKHVLANGDERYFFEQINASGKPRFTSANMLPLVPLLAEYFPEEWKKYTENRVVPPKYKSLEEYHAYLVFQRFYNMYYDHDGKARGRTWYSREHPTTRWPSKRQAEARARLVEVGWPWS